MTKERLFRLLICLLVICCLVINMTPVGVEASSVSISAGSIVTGDPAIGIASILFAMAMGVVFTDLSYDSVRAFDRQGLNVYQIFNAAPLFGSCIEPKNAFLPNTSLHFRSKLLK